MDCFGADAPRKDGFISIFRLVREISSVTGPDFALWLAHRSGPKSRAGRICHGRQGQRIRSFDADHAGAGVLTRAARPSALHVDVAIKGGLWLTTADGGERYGELVAVMPNVRHTIASDYRSAICLVIEPESVPSGTFEELSRRLWGPEAEVFASRIRAAYAQLRRQQYSDEITSAEFD